MTDLALSSSPQNLELFIERNGVAGNSSPSISLYLLLFSFVFFSFTSFSHPIYYAGVSLCLHFLLNLAKLPSSKSKMDTVFSNVHTTLSILLHFFNYLHLFHLFIACIIFFFFFNSRLFLVWTNLDIIHRVVSAPLKTIKLVSSLPLSSFIHLLFD